MFMGGGEVGWLTVFMQNPESPDGKCHSAHMVPIPGAKRRKYLEENSAAAGIRLTPADVAELEAAVPQSEVVGDRYSVAGMKAIDR